MSTDGLNPEPRTSAMIVGSWLPYSETFIYDQIQQQTQFRAWVLARHRRPEATQFPYDRVHTLAPWEQATYPLGWAPSVSRRLDSIQPEIVHAHFGLNATLILPFIRRRNVPLVVTFHGHDVAGLFPQNAWTTRYALYQRLAPEMFARASLLLCCAIELAERLLERGAPANKVRIHHLGVDTQRFRFVDRPEQTPIFLMVGRLVEKKGMRYFLSAFAKMKAQGVEARVRIIGDGPLRPELQAQAQALDIDGSVEFLGVRSSDEVRDAMQAADVLVAPSVTGARGDRESGVIVLKEAAATGLPTIGTRHGGIPEIIDDEVTGYLVDERNVDALAERARRLAINTALRHQLGRAARAKVERDFDSKVQNRRLEEILASTI